MTAHAETLWLIADRRRRRPARGSVALDALFRRLGACRREEEAIATEDHIWLLWMYHPHRSAAQALDLAADDIAARRYDIAETRLSMLLRYLPDFAEAWHKRATLYYLLGRDESCVDDLRRTIELEPRHFGALCSFAEILLGEGERESARFAFSVALSLHPYLTRARQVIESVSPKAPSSDNPFDNRN
jgi:tetratricopeptide (TPR) repeat protein